MRILKDKIKNGNVFYFFTMLHLSLAPYTFGLFISLVFLLLGPTLSIAVYESVAFLPVYLVISSLFLTAIPILGYFANSRDKFFDVFKFKKISIVNVILIVLISLFIQPLMSVLSVVGMFFSENYISDVVVDLSKAPFLVALFTIAVVPAVLEEFLMRGVVLKYYEDLPLFKLATINGLFFGLMHGNLQQFFYAAFLGFVFVYFVKLTGSIVSSMLAHFVINGSQLVLTYVFWSDEATSSAASSAVTILDLIYTILYAIPFTAVCVFLMVLFFKHNKETLNNIKAQEKSNKENGVYDGVKVIDKFFIAMLAVYFVALLFI